MILSRPAIKSAANHFRLAARAWDELGLALLPDQIAPFKEAREIMHRRSHLFRTQGNAAIQDIRTLQDQFKALKVQMKTNFPLSADEVISFRETLAEHVMHVHDVEKVAVSALREAMA
jgi:hypothetical protein